MAKVGGTFSRLSVGGHPEHVPDGRPTREVRRPAARRPLEAGCCQLSHGSPRHRLRTGCRTYRPHRTAHRGRMLDRTGAATRRKTAALLRRAEKARDGTVSCGTTVDARDRRLDHRTMDRTRDCARHGAQPRTTDRM